MNWQEIIMAILRIVIILITPIIGLLLAKAAQAVTAYLGVKSDNDLIQYYMDEVKNAVEVAVKYANQKFVDALKSAGEFGDKAKHNEALEIAKKQALLQLTEDTKAYICKTYGSLDLYIEGRLEAEVGDQKKAKSTTSATEAPASTAAVTAAATAASVAQVAAEQIRAEVLGTPPAED